MTVEVVQISQPDLDRKERILSLLESRRATYGSVVVKSVLARDQDEWKNAISLFQVSHKADPPAKEETHHYSNCTVATRNLSLDEFAGLVEILVSKRKLKIDDLPELAVEGTFSPIRYNERIPSNDEIFGLDWPANVFHYEPKVKGFPAEPFVALEAPLFPTPWEVLRVWSGIDVSRYNQFQGAVVLTLPNYLARIEELRLASGSLTLRIRARETSADRVLAKLYCEGFGEGVVQRDVEFSQDTAVVPLGFVPDFWEVHILSKEDGEPLDFRKVHASWATLPPGVMVEVGPADIEEVLSRGENEHVEFKPDVSSRQDDFLETVVAFCNTGGGTVLVGVSDKGKPIGVADQNLEEMVQNLVRSRCDPPPEIAVEKKELQGKWIYLVRVSDGDNKPYNLRDRGFYVRAGSTDRLATRTEMDRFYAQRQGPALGVARLY